MKRADETPLDEIVTRLQTHKQRGEAGTLSTNHVHGATVTLSNYDMLRTVTWATPVLTPGQAAVLGIGRAALRMVVHEADPRGWSVRRVLPVSLTYDHRIVNGVPAGRFLDDLAGSFSTRATRCSIDDLSGRRYRCAPSPHFTHDDTTKGT